MFTLGPSFLKSFPSDIPSLFQFLQLIILLASYITPIEKPLSLIPSQSYRSTFSSLLTFNCHFPTLKNIRIQLPDSLVHLCYINATKIRLGSSYSSFFFSSSSFSHDRFCISPLISSVYKPLSVLFFFQTKDSISCIYHLTNPPSIHHQSSQARKLPKFF